MRPSGRKPAAGWRPLQVSQAVQHRADGIGRSSAMADRMIFANSERGNMTSAIWKIIERPCRTILAPIFTAARAAWALTPAEWTALAEDERMQPIFTPLVGFIENNDPKFELAEDIE
jgi:hypothetical protein